MFDAVKVKDKCVLWIRDFFERNGKGCNAIVGISGGKDSSVNSNDCLLTITYNLTMHHCT